MRPTALEFLVCPACKSELALHARLQEGPNIVEGTLECRQCVVEYPILRGIPRFVRETSYASSFGYQWRWFRTVQLDSFNGTNESERTLAATTGWTDEDYVGSLVLDVGVGAGRFAESHEFTMIQSLRDAWGATCGPEQASVHYYVRKNHFCRWGILS